MCSRVCDVSMFSCFLPAQSKLDTCSNALKQSLRVRIDLKSKSADELKAMSVKELKAAMIDNNIDPRGCLEKQELVDKIIANIK